MHDVSSQESPPPRDAAEFIDPLSDYEPTQYASKLAAALAEETVEAIIYAPFLRIRPSATVGQVVQAMASSRSSCAVVMDRNRLLGVFTERDVLEKVAERYDSLTSRPVTEVMTADPTVVYESDPAATALAAIAVAGHRHVPVLGIDDALVGVLSPRHVFSFLEQYFDDGLRR